MEHIAIEVAVSEIFRCNMDNRSLTGTE